MVVANLEYIGKNLEIVELKDGRHCTVVMVCDWVKANYRGRNATVRKDEWGFTLANFNSMVLFGYESFAFSIHCDQVFFLDEDEEPGWKVVLRTEVWGRRIDSKMEEEEEIPIFSMGSDSVSVGLRAPETIPETTLDPIPTGRHIQLNEILNEVVEE